MSAFNDLVAELESHQTAVRFQSNSGDYLNHPCYNSLVQMGKAIIPLVMEKCARDQTGWWHELLFEIEMGRKSGAGIVSKDDLFEKRKTIHEEGITWKTSIFNVSASAMFS